jgi:hypothetical protein
LLFILIVDDKLYIHLIEHPSDASWGCEDQEIGLQAKSHTDGKLNTETIVAFHNDASNFDGNSYYDCIGHCEVLGCHSDNDGTVAAKVCSDLIDDYLGYNDWYLPASAQLETMYNYRNDVDPGDFESDWSGYVSSWYWSSTEYSVSNAYSIFMSNGSIINRSKTSSSLVRCVRDP